MDDQHVKCFRYCGGTKRITERAVVPFTPVTMTMLVFQITETDKKLSVFFSVLRIAESICLYSITVFFWVVEVT